MYPYLFGIRALDMFEIMIALGLILAVLGFKLTAKVMRMEKPSYEFYSVAYLFAIAAGFVFAVLFQQLYNLIEYWVNGVPYMFRGITFMGGLVGGVVTFVLITAFKAQGAVRADFYKAASYAVPSLLLAHGMGRIGCFCAGCCHGVATDSVFGMHFPTLNARVFPTQLYEAIFLFVMFAVSVILLYRFKIYKPQLIIYGIGYSVFRFFVEYLRGDYRGSFLPGLSPSQAQSVILFCVSAALLVAVYVYNVIPFSPPYAGRGSE